MKIHLPKIFGSGRKESGTSVLVIDEHPDIPILTTRVNRRSIFRWRRSSVRHLEGQGGHVYAPPVEKTQRTIYRRPPQETQSPVNANAQKHK